MVKALEVILITIFEGVDGGAATVVLAKLSSIRNYKLIN
jgi:hypothetical protein